MYVVFQMKHVKIYTYWKRYNMAKIFILMGKSSTGKDTIYSKIIENKELNLKKIIPYTTRPMRENEVEGKEYFFVNEAFVRKSEKQKKIIELRSYDTVFGNWKYFTMNDSQIDMQGNDNYIIIGTLETFEKIKDYYGEKKVIPIYIEVEDKIRIQRAISRENLECNPQYSELCRRYLADEIDFSEDRLNKLKIHKRYQNKELDLCINEISNDIKSCIN